MIQQPFGYTCHKDHDGSIDLDMESDSFNEGDGIDMESDTSCKCNKEHKSGDEMILPTNFRTMMLKENGNT